MRPPTSKPPELAQPFMNTDKKPEHAASRSAPLTDVVKDGGSEIKQTLGHMAHDGKEAVGQMVDDGKSRVGDMVEEGQARVGDWTSDLGKAVRERPIQSVLIASGVGAALGMLLRGRSA